MAIIKGFREMYRAAVYNDGDQLKPDEEKRGWQKDKGWQNATEVICMLEKRFPPKTSPMGVEPMTSRLTAARSDQLS